MPGPKRVFLVEDHAIFREGLAEVMKAEPDLTICGQAANATQALSAISNLKPDLVVVDITLPGKSGLQLIKEVRAINRRVKLLALSMHDEAIYADRVLRAGGDGYIMKQEDPEEIIRAIRDVLQDRIYVSERVFAAGPGAARQEDSPLDRLADLELEILELLGREKTDAEISDLLHLSPQMVTHHCLQIRRKLNLKSNDALQAFAAKWSGPRATEQRADLQRH